MPYWLDDLARPEPVPPLGADTSADLLVVGGGYTGLWTALRAKERAPARDVVVLEAGRCGGAASGRNGGFAEPSLTHGLANAMARWPDEVPTLLRMGTDNIDGLVDTVARHGIDCGLERTGELVVATRAHEVAGLVEEVAHLRALGKDADLLDAAAAQQRVASPTYLAAQRNPEVVMLEPARLAWGLRRVCLELGVRIHEDSAVSGLGVRGRAVVARTERATVRADRVVLGTNASRPLLRRLRLMSVPVHDYTIVTEPLDPAQRQAIGWAGREGVSDAGNLFHYYRLTRDDRLLFGGYDAVYHYGSRADARTEHRETSYTLLVEHLLQTFPQLGGVRIGHCWGGVIDTCTRFCCFWGTAMSGRVAYALGFTGLGVAATRFAADTALDLVDGLDTERTALRMVRETPMPFPPEPVRWVGIEATVRSKQRADRTGRDNLWLKAMDKLGLGFDS
ncbi:MAG: FAD-dependent oxidoreductase [Nocardioidaceae bacterium]|nr:FAD-dependent oxidoreductase [Nocardioidaceae bacterium]